MLVTFLPILAAYYLTRDGDQIAGAGNNPASVPEKWTPVFR